MSSRHSSGLASTAGPFYIGHDKIARTQELEALIDPSVITNASMRKLYAMQHLTSEEATLHCIVYLYQKDGDFMTVAEFEERKATNRRLHDDALQANIVRVKTERSSATEYARLTRLR